MLDNMMERGLLSLIESNHLRLEAMHLFEQCLTNGDDSALVAFIEQQLLHEPPRLQLLRDLADDLQQRLLSLREYHFDVRDRVVRTLSEDYNVDLTALTSPSKLEQYHHLTTDEILTFIHKNDVVLNEDDLPLIRKMVDASLQMAAQLFADIQLTTHLHNLVLDWLEGMNATVARQQWNKTHPSQEKTTTIIYH